MTRKRAIFEEVAPGATPAEKPKTGMIDQVHVGRGGIVGWLMALFALVLVMIFIGGLTRLTDSGLSITEWNPLSGALPPLTSEAWTAEFDRYKRFPEYQLQNAGMSLAEFKGIYWWEWGHRQLGRLIGLVWAVGFFGFLASKRMPKGWTGRLFGVGALIGVQGAVGWWMVASGLSSGQVDVASYRLAIHLGLAFVLLGLIAVYVLALGRGDGAMMLARRSRDIPLSRLTAILLGLMFFQILLGALVAGIDAGRGFTDWPLMAGRFFPEGALDLTPLWRNFFEDAGLVQFMHRMTGYGVFAFGLYAWWRSRSSGNRLIRQAFDMVVVFLLVQMGLGIGTVMLGAPVSIAIIHQLGAVVLWVLIIRALHLADYPPVQSVRGA